MKRKRSRKGAPGIVEVAARAGVSIATVSRAFNEPEKVRGPTRVRIEEAANDLGYIRDRMAGTLHNRFSGTIGLIVPTIDNAIFAELIESFSARLLDHDRTTLIASNGYDLAQEVPIVRSLLERRIDGIALVGLDHEEVPLTMLSQRDVPIISIWNYQQDATIPCIGSDNHQAGSIVTEHILNLGHKDIAFLFPETTNNDRARNRREGAMRAIEASGLNLPEERIITCGYNIETAKRITRQLLNDNPPTAIICGNDVIARGAIYACHAENIPVPEKISIVGIGDFTGSSSMEPGLTTVRFHARKIGKLAADVIVNMSETGFDPSPFSQKVDLSFYDRGSTRRLN